ncbi:MAG: DEAD/DEAH box helicase [Mariprofundaceae bacterium]|nr:DEAD/DEAH box helicase [Mariprofundaceae bacterium]
MARISFGNTWWGKKWLDALARTDYSNRLPRGMSYARKGSVKHLSILGKRVEASVQGSHRAPYEVEIALPTFNAAQKKAVVESIAGNPLLLSHLLIRKLPPALLHEFETRKVALFPKSWDDVGAQCSCPDWAACCKHIAAVIYMIANEIDKNPFILFDLHDFDLFKALEKKGFKTEKQAALIPNAKDYLLKIHPEKQEKSMDIDLACLDFSTVEKSTGALVGLLPESPLFYPAKDFRLILEKFLNIAAKETARLLAGWDKQEVPLDLFTDLDVSLGADLHVESIDLSAIDKQFTYSSDEELIELLSMLYRLPRKQLHSHHRGALVLSLAAHLVLTSLKQGTILPELMAVKGGYRIRWLPALLTAEMRTLFEAICALSPVDLIRKPTLSIEEQVKTLCAIFLDTLIRIFSEVNAAFNADHITGLFFCGSTWKPSSAFDEKEIPGSIALWLSRLHISRKSIVPLLKIEEESEGFSLHLFAEDRADEFSPPIPFKTILSDKKYADARLPLLKDVALLTDYIPHIATLLATSGDDTAFFDGEDFVALFFQQLPLLRLLGIPLLLPKGLNKLIRPGISAHVKKATAAASAKSYLSLDEMLSFEWRIALGDELLTAEEFRKLTLGAKGIVKIKDSFVYLDEKELQKLWKGLEKEPKLSTQDRLRIVLSGEYEGATLHLDDEVRRLIDELLHVRTIPVPNALKADLRAYQQRGFEWLAKNIQIGFGSLIADDMGLGKTIQVIALMLKMKEDGMLAKEPALVVVPTTLLTNWNREIEKFAPNLKVHTYHGSDRKLEVKDNDLILTSYGLVRRDEAIFQKQRWAVAILDEAQNIKNPGTAQTKAIKKIKSSLRIAMTGTPVENRLSEYWSIFDFLNKGYLKGEQAFKKEFALPIERNRSQVALDRFQKITSPFIIRRLKSDKSIISDLPDKVEMDQYCCLSTDQAALYQNVLDQALKKIKTLDGIERRGLVLQLITSLKQVCNHPSHYLKKSETTPELSGKAALLMDLLSTMEENGEKVIIFTQYRQMGELLKAMIRERFSTEALFLHGGVSRKKRDDMVDRFQGEPYTKIMILSLKAGGTGLNLTAAQNVIHFDLWWNPAVEAQATDRAYRIGQTKNVMVHRLITKGTFEEKIDRMIKDKKELADLAVLSGEKWIGEFGDNELRDIFSLGE